MAADLPPLTAHNVAEHLQALSLQLGKLCDEIEEADHQAVDLREDATQAKSKAFLRAEGPMDMRNAQAIVDSSAARITADHAEVHVRGLKRRIETVRLRVEVGRSIGAALRAETGLASGGMTP